MSGALNKIVPAVVLLAAAAALAGAGVMFLTTDETATAGAGAEDISIPSAPPVVDAADLPTAAFTRPMFHRDRAPGSDKAPAVSSNDTSAIPETGEEPAAGFRLKGVIIGERGARVALQADGAGAPTWAGVGDVVDGWTVEAVNARRVRLRNGDDVIEIQFEDKQ